MTQRFIAIGGCSCSGKTTLAEYLATELGAEILPIDDYYTDLSHLSLQQRGRMNFDAPGAIDVELLLAAFSHQVVFPAGLGAEKADLQF
jgi:uridine kinase